MEIRLGFDEMPFSLDYTLSCGQTFRWIKLGDWWTGIVSQAVLKIRQKNRSLELRSSTDAVDANFVRRYFRLDDNLPKVYSQIIKDDHVRQAVKQFPGLRLLRQEPWECLISYLCATNKNIPAIKRMIYNLCGRYGKRLKFEDQEYYGFPEPDALTQASVEQLRSCKLGYRAERLLETAKLVYKRDFDLEALKTMPYETAKKELLTLPGVGPKVADCVLLFSLDKLNAFPIDVWMKRIILKYYSQQFETKFVAKAKAKTSLTLREYQIIRDFGTKHFGEYVGYAQEYLYHHERCQARKNENT
jgi:N-glycosylase/DNA lyase